MVYEVRTYTLRPGTVAEFEERFAKRKPLREKHSKLGAFWHTDFGPLNQVIHAWPYENLQHRTAVRDAMAKDAELQALPGGRDLIVEQQADIVIPAPFMQPLGSRNFGTGNFYEMRIYTYAPGDIPKVLEAWGKAVPIREKLSPLAACWTSELGGLNKFVHVWLYKDSNERTRIRDESRKGGQWPPQIGSAADPAGEQAADPGGVFAPAVAARSHPPGRCGSGLAARRAARARPVLTCRSAWRDFWNLPLWYRQA